MRYNEIISTHRNTNLLGISVAISAWSTNSATVSCNRMGKLKMPDPTPVPTPDPSPAFLSV